MNWPFPSENQDPWYDVFRDMVSAQDASGHAAREDRNVLMGGGGLVSFTATTGVLSWDENFEIFSTAVGFLFTVTAGSVVLQDGQLCYVDLVRSPTGSSVLTLSVASQAPQSDTSYVVALRRGSDVYFRFGSKVSNGESLNPFEGGGGAAGSDTYERSATFSIPDLSSVSQEATLGRTSYGGSLVALSLELTEAVIAGSITVTIKRDGVSTLVAVLDVSNPTSVQTIAPVDTWPVSSNSALTVLVEPSGYDNASGDPGGLTVNLALTTGLSLAPTDIVDASNTIKGVTKLSVAAAIANDPIAVGDNDPRIVFAAVLNAVQEFTKSQRSHIVALTDATTVVYSAEDSNIFSLVATGAVGATRELDNPTDLVAGMTWQVWFIQDGTGGRALTFDTFYDWGDEGAPDFSTQVANEKNIITFVALSSTQIAATSLLGFA